MSTIPSGLGKRRPQLDIPIDNLHPDPQNPRLPKDYQGKAEPQIIEALYKFFNLQEIAVSMQENGYFDAEPLVAIPNSLPNSFFGKSYSELKDNPDYTKFIEDVDTHFTVVEGNRRLSTAKLLLEGTKRTFPELTDDNIIADLEELPVIIYPERRDVLAYIGARHIIGTKKWDAYAKARYIASLKEDHELEMNGIQKIVGDTTQSVRKIYACYRLIERIEEEYENIETVEAKDNFSFLILATGQRSIKDFIGLNKKWNEIDFDSDIIPDNKMDALKHLFIWLFGDGKEQRKLIKESRDITNYLSDILRSPESTQHLIDTGDLQGAFDRSGGEERLVEKYVKQANNNLEKALGLLHRHRTEEVKTEVKKLEETLKVALDILKDV